jgi:DNA-binding Lrp family transcriptional regulator
MALTKRDARLIAAIQDGIPLVSEPYRAIAESIGESEDWVLERIGELIASRAITRWGLVAVTHEVGFTANGLVVWDVPDDRVAEIAKAIAGTGLVTRCYQRHRVSPRWRYNVFSMIHGQERDEVRQRAEEIRRQVGLEALPYEVLFTGRRFLQRGARYVEIR